MYDMFVFKLFRGCKLYFAYAIKLKRDLISLLLSNRSCQLHSPILLAPCIDVPSSKVL
jgi:hypothetical protein